MKFMKILAFFLALSIMLNDVHSLHLKSKSKSKSKFNAKTDSTIMEFLGNLYSSANNVITTRKNPEGTTQAKKVTRKIKLVTEDSLVKDEQDLTLIQEGYLKISSPNFTNEQIYPNIVLPDFNQSWIATKENTHFRLNKMYDESKKTDAKFPPTPESFYFRLSFRNIWYTYTKDNVEVLGSIPVDALINAEEKKELDPKKKNKEIEDYCIIVSDRVNAKWELCSSTEQDRITWMCNIKKLKLIPDDRCSPAKIKEYGLAKVPVTEFERKVTQPIILIPQANRFCNDDWNYEAKGQDWECDCKEGLEQSPINIETKNVIESPVVPVFTYTEVEVKKVENTSDGQVKDHKYVKMFNENHMLQIRADSFGTVVTLDGTTYNANRIVFHTPSEHTIDGKQYPMEMQVIHKGTSEGALTNHIVLSFLFVKKPGIYNKFLDDVDFFNLPNPIAIEKKMENNLYLPKIFYNSDDEDIPIMRPFSMYTYQGSLTAPPCTQRTIHYISAEPIEIGSTAIELFQEAIRMPDMRASNGDVVISTATNENNRKIQPLNGRNVFYNKVSKEDLSVLKKAYESPKPVGHYEKIMKEINNYYYVNNNSPSGMPGAIVVSENEAKGLGN